MAADPYNDPHLDPYSDPHHPNVGQPPPKPGVAARVERASAMVAGAAEGLVDEVRRQDLARTSQQAVQEVEHIARETFGGTDKRHRVSDAIERGRQRLESAAHETKERAEAVSESARRAAHAPARVAEDLKHAASSWAGGMFASLGLLAAAGAIAIVAFTVFTVGAVQGLNALIGSPGGTFLVALVYGLVAGICLAMARRARERGRKKAAKQVEEAREEVRRVARPMRRAFSRRQH